MPLMEECLVVKKSTLPGAGNGLFTRVAIPKGTRIAEYRGRHTTWKEVDHRNGTNAYIYYVHKNLVIDARTYPSTLARYANDANGLSTVKGLVNNCMFVKDGVRVFLETIKQVKAGEELLVAYGQGYWDAVRKNMAT